MTAAATNVLIIGGGLSGLAAGIELRKHCIEVDLVESNSGSNSGECAEGSGASLGGAGMRALRRLGVLEAVLRHGAAWDGVDVFTRSGAKLATLPALHCAEPGAPGNGAIRYPVLMRILSGVARDAGVAVRPGRSFVSMEQDRDGVSVDFCDGSRGRYDLVVGADGLHSRARRTLLPDESARHECRQGTWQVVLPRMPELGRSAIWLGKGVKIALNPVARDAMCLSATAESSCGAQADPMRRRAALRSLLAGFPAAPVRQVLAQLDEATPVTYRPLTSVLVPSPWYRQRVVFIGDAVHTSTPHVVSGACTGIEDAIVLGEELSRTGSITQALDRYFTRRWSRCRTVVRNSKRLLDIELEGGNKKEHDRLLQEMLQVLDNPI